MDINDRILELRKSLGLSQSDFGEKIGVSRGVIKNIEYKLTVPKDAQISLICKVFGVSETWLNTGEGEMFSTADEEFEFAQLLAGSFGRDLPPIVKSIVKTTLKLDDESAACIDRFIKEVAKNLSNDEK